MAVRRRALMAAAVGAASLPRFAIGQGVPELQTMRSTSKSWLWAAEDYANEAGFFTKAQVKVVSNASNRGTNIAALGGSGVDIVLGDPGETIRAKGQGFPVKTFIGTVNKYASHVVLRKSVMDRAGVTEASPVAQKIAALKGLRLGTTGPGAAPDAMFRWLAVQGKMDPTTDMRLVVIQGGGPGMIAGLQQNVIDGFCLSSPTSDLAVLQADSAYLFNMVLNPPPELSEYLYIIASANEASYRNAAKREALVRYSHGVGLALKAMAADRAALRAWADKWFDGLPPQIADVSFDINSRIFFQDPVPKPDLFQKNIDFINAVNRTMSAEPVPASITFDALFDPSVAREGMARL